VVGAVLEERYERLDDGSQLNHAHLKKVWQLAWGTENAASTVLPGDGGIHRMGNSGNGMAISVHLFMGLAWTGRTAVTTTTPATTSVIDSKAREIGSMR
jgi:hypothetical protein